MSGDLHDAVRIAHQNTLNAISVGLGLIEKGHFPFIPHLTHFIHMHSEIALSKTFYRSYDMIWLKFCDALYFIAPSEGANRELRIAEQSGLRIFRRMREVPTVVEGSNDAK